MFALICCDSCANSCKGSKRVFVGSVLVSGVFVHRMCVNVHGLFLRTLLGLLYFLVAGAVMRSFPAGSPCYVSVPVFRPFPVNGEEEHIGNRMSIPGRSGH